MATIVKLDGAWDFSFDAVDAGLIDQWYRKKPAQTKSLVMELERLTSMKNHRTRVALQTAIVIAQMKLYSPSSSFETATVVIVSSSSVANTAA